MANRFPFRRGVLQRDGGKGGTGGRGRGRGRGRSCLLLLRRTFRQKMIFAATAATAIPPPSAAIEAIFSFFHFFGLDFLPDDSEGERGAFLVPVRFLLPFL